MWNSELTTEEKQAALMNVIVIMLADGKIKPEELYVLQLVAKRVGATKEEIEDIVRNPQKVKFVLPRTQKERVAQLIDMITMMAIDGDIDQREADIGVKFALALGFSPLKVAELINKIAGGLKKGKSRDTITEDITLVID